MKLFEAANSVDMVGYTTAFHNFHWVKDGGQWATICPFHGDSKPSYKHKVSTNKGKCFVCAAGAHSLVDLIAEYLKIEPAKAAQLICEDMGLQYEENPKQGRMGE